MKDVEKIIKQFEAAMQEQERKNYNYAFNGLQNKNITFRFDESENETLIRFNPCEEELVLEFDEYKFLRDINPSLLWYCYNNQPIPLAELESLSIQDQALIITKCIEECECMCSYEYYSNLLASCT